MDAPAGNKRRQVEPDLASIDFFGLLPDDMLVIIISFLPLKFAFRISVLSKGWRPLWCFVPLNLIVDDDLSGWESFRVDAMYKILSTHPSPASLLSIAPHAFSTTFDLGDKLGEWFRFRALDDLEDLTFSGGTPEHKLPRSAFHFAPTLRVLHLGCCYIPKLCAASALLFPQLKQLELKSVRLSKVAFERLLACCIALEGLLLDGIHGFRRLHLVSPSLQDLSVSTIGRRAGCWLQDLIVHDTPCLLRLVILGPVDPRSVTFVSAPKLKGLAYKPAYSFYFHVGVIKGEDKSSTGLSFYTVKVRAIRSLDGDDISHVGQYLKMLLSNDRKLIKSAIDKDTMLMLCWNITNPLSALMNTDIVMKIDSLWDRS